MAFSRYPEFAQDINAPDRQGYRDGRYLLKSFLDLPLCTTCMTRPVSCFPDKPISSQWSLCHRVPSNRCRAERPPDDHSLVASHDTGGRVQLFG